MVAWLAPWFAYGTIRVLGRAVRLEVISPEIPGSLWERGIPIYHGLLARKASHDALGL